MPAGISIWQQLKMASGSGILNGPLPFAQNNWYVGSGDPPVPLNAIKRTNTIAEALALMIPGDTLNIGPGGYGEGNLVVPEGLNNITIIGQGNRGACFIEPSVAGDEGLTVLADDVTLVNIGVADGGSGTYALAVGSQTVSPSRFRAYGCKFEGSAIACLLRQAGDVIIDDCEFAWAAIGLQLQSGDIGFNTQVKLINLLFHNNADACISQAAAAQQVNNLQLLNSFFDQLEDGTEPTDFILLADNGNTGLIAGNQFAIATNASAKLTIGTGIMWGPNGTEAGWSTARPA